MSSGSTARSDCSIRLSARGRKAGASSNVSVGTRRWTQSGVAGPNLPGQLHHAGEQFVLVNPKDALARNVGEGSPVRVFNDRGSFEAIAKVSSDVMPGVVVAPMGYWRSLSRTGATVNALNPSAFADL